MQVSCTHKVNSLLSGTIRENVCLSRYKFFFFNSFILFYPLCHTLLCENIYGSSHFPSITYLLLDNVCGKVLEKLLSKVSVAIFKSHLRV